MSIGQNPDCDGVIIEPNLCPGLKVDGNRSPSPRISKTLLDCYAYTERPDVVLDMGSNFKFERAGMFMKRAVVGTRCRHHVSASVRTIIDCIATGDGGFR